MQRQKAGIRSGHTKKVIFCVHLSCCFEKVLRYVTSLVFGNLSLLHSAFPCVLIQLRKSCQRYLLEDGISESWDWSWWKPLTHVNKLLLFPHDLFRSVADLWFDVVLYRRTNAALQLQLELKGELQEINFICKFSYCHLLEIHLSKGAKHWCYIIY